MDNKYTLTVAEPWDFKSPDGQNIITGFILKIISNECLLFKTNHVLKFETIESDIFILCQRNHLGDFTELFYRPVDVNCGVLPKDYDQHLNQADLQILAQFKMIATISKV